MTDVTGGAEALEAVVVSNGVAKGVEGLDGLFPPDARARYRTVSTSPGFAPDFAGADLVVVPNGSSEYGGALLVPTPDPVVGHGIQQVRRPDHSCDNLTAWPCGVRPAGRFEVDPAAYGRPWADPRAADPRAADPRAAGAPAA